MSGSRRLRPASRILHGIGVAAVCLGVFSCKAKSSPSGAATISGIITDVINASAVSGAAVAVQGKNTTTGSDGHYSISGLAAGDASLTVQHQGHDNFSQNVTLASSTSLNVAITPAKAAQGAGAYAGTWKNTNAGTTGSLKMNASADTIGQKMTVTMDGSGKMFGVADPIPITGTTGYTTTGGSFSTTTPFGNVSVTVTSSGQITGSLNNITVGGISRLDFSGSMTTSQITVNYTVTYSNGSTQSGTVSMAK